MGAVRGYVFPALRILIWAVIALSLAWLAFFRGNAVTDQSAQPSVDVRPPVINVARGDIYNTVNLRI